MWISVPHRAHTFPLHYDCAKGPVLLFPISYPFVQLTDFPRLDSVVLHLFSLVGDSRDHAMNKKSGHLLSRRQFAQRAAVLSATASLVPAGAILPGASVPSAAQDTQNAPKLTPDGQVEADSRYQQILGLYGSRFDDAQKANLKRMCAELQPALENIRNFKLENGDAPALYLKPLVELEKKPQATVKPQPSSAPKKP